MQFTRNIGVIGFMGTGKTTIGNALAEKTGKQFLDTDTLIEEQTGKSIIEIFSDEGEISFRNIESEVVRMVCRMDSCVISFGGGVVLSKSNINEIRRSSFVILLKATAETIARRIQSESVRPLLTNRENHLAKITQLLTERASLYRNASDIEIETDSLSVDQVVHEIMRRISA